MKRIEVAAGLVFRRGKLLITRRRAEDHLGGFWEFPGGKRERGETFRKCLARELREELGIEVKPGRLLATVNHDYPDNKVRLKFFTGELVEGKPRPIGCAAVRWVTRAGLARHRFPEADARLIRKVMKSGKLWR